MGFFLGLTGKKAAAAAGKGRKAAGTSEGKAASPAATGASGGASGGGAGGKGRRISWSLIGLVVLLAALAPAWYLGEQALVSYAREHRPGVADAQRITLVNAPAWMSPALTQEIQCEAAGPLSADLFDGKSLEDVVAALAANPWVEEVQRVQRLSSGRLLVRATYRQPTAAVESDDGYHLVDAKGVVLPVAYQEEQLTLLGLPRIEGVAAQPAKAGETWVGEDLQAGLGLAQILVRQPYYQQVQAIDVGQRDSRGRICLVLQTMSGQVRWGLPLGKEHSVEPVAAVKLKWLGTVYEQCGMIDAGGKTVDLFGPTILVHAEKSDAQVKPASYSNR